MRPTATRDSSALHDLVELDRALGAGQLRNPIIEAKPRPCAQRKNRDVGHRPVSQGDWLARLAGSNKRSLGNRVVPVPGILPSRGDVQHHMAVGRGEARDGPGGLGPIAVAELVHQHLEGAANRDLAFDQVDLVQVLQTAKYLTAQEATWGEGDWNGAPGGSPGDPPLGDGVFDQLDIVAALLGNTYLTGPYAATRTGGVQGDEQTSTVYDARTGEIAVDAPASRRCFGRIISSEAGIFSNEPFRGGPGYNIFSPSLSSWLVQLRQSGTATSDRGLRCQ